MRRFAITLCVSSLLFLSITSAEETKPQPVTDEPSTPSKCDDKTIDELYTEIGLVSCWSAAFSYSDKCQKFINDTLGIVGAAYSLASPYLDAKANRLNMQLENQMLRHEKFGKSAQRSASDLRTTFGEREKRQLVDRMLKNVAADSSEAVSLAATRTILSRQINHNSRALVFRGIGGALAVGGYAGLFISALDYVSEKYDAHFVASAGDMYSDRPYRVDGKIYFDRVPSGQGYIDSYEIGPKIRDFLRLEKSRQMEVLKVPWLCNYYRNVTANMSSKRHELQKRFKEITFLKKPMCAKDGSKVIFDIEARGKKLTFAAKTDPSTGIPQEMAVLPLTGNDHSNPPYIYRYNTNASGEAEIVSIETKSVMGVANTHTIQNMSQLAAENPIRHQNVYNNLHLMNFWGPHIHRCCRGGNQNSCYKAMGFNFSETTESKNAVDTNNGEIPRSSSSDPESL